MSHHRLSRYCHPSHVLRQRTFGRKTQFVGRKIDKVSHGAWVDRGHVQAMHQLPPRREQRRSRQSGPSGLRGPELSKGEANSSKVKNVWQNRGMGGAGERAVKFGPSPSGQVWRRNFTPSTASAFLPKKWLSFPKGRLVSFYEVGGEKRATSFTRLILPNFSNSQTEEWRLQTEDSSPFSQIARV